MVSRSLSEQRWSQTCEAAEPEAAAVILWARAEQLGTKGGGWLVAERAVRHYKMMIIISNKPFPPPFLLLEKRR